MDLHICNCRNKKIYPTLHMNNEYSFPIFKIFSVKNFKNDTLNKNNFRCKNGFAILLILDNGLSSLK